MHCRIKPLGSRVVMKRESLTSDTLIIPDTARQRNAPARGVIVEKGPMCEWPIEEGKTYLHGQFAGAYVNAEGRAITDEEDEFYMVDEEDLIAEVRDV